MSCKSPLLILGTTLLLLYTGHSMPSSVMFLAVYNSSATRARAHQVCQEAGDRLPQLESEHKSTMVNRAIRSLMQEEATSFSEIDFNYWIGLELEYTWADQTMVPANWTGWQNKSPPPINCSRTCVTSDANGHWSRAFCFQKNHVVCEFTSKDENCAFQAYQGSIVRVINDSLSSPYTSITRNLLSARYCGEFCLDYFHGCQECWVWSYMEERCVIYVSCSPILPDVTSLERDKPSFTFHFKNCYIGYLNSTDISENNHTYGEDTVTVSTTPIESTTQTGIDITTEERLTTVTDITGTTKYKCEPIGDYVTFAVSDMVETEVSTIPITTEEQRQTSHVPLNDPQDLITEPVPTLCVCSSPSSLPVTGDTPPGLSSSTDLPDRVSTSKYSKGSVEKLLESLNVNVTKTSAYRRRYTSATDDRPSAQSVGYVGIALMCAFAGVIVCFDLDFAIDRLVIFWRG